MEVVPTRHVVLATSPCPVIVGESPVKAVSLVVPVVEASFNLCPVLPVNGLLEDKTKVHVAGVPLSSVADCRLVVPFGCDVEMCSCRCGKWKGGTTCAFSSLRAN